MFFIIEVSGEKIKKFRVCVKEISSLGGSCPHDTARYILLQTLKGRYRFIKS